MDGQSETTSPMTMAQGRLLFEQGKAILTQIQKLQPLLALLDRGPEDPAVELDAALLKQAAEGHVVEVAVGVHVAEQGPVREPHGVAVDVKPGGLLAEAAH